jgi:molecular chaperone DnaK (HSP70)
MSRLSKDEIERMVNDAEKYKKEDLLSIMWVKTDDKGFHHFEIVLRSK